MEYYTVEIDDEIFDNEDNNITDYTPCEFSIVRFNATIHQMDLIWGKVYDQINFVRNMTNDINASNKLVYGMYKLFFMEHKMCIGYYSDYNIRQRMKPMYKQNKLLNIRNRC